MGWGDLTRAERLIEDILEAYASAGLLSKVQDEAYRNSLSVTREDGLDWIRTMLKRKPGYRGEVPVWTKRALRDIRDEKGWKNLDVARFLGMDRKGRVDQWLTETVPEG